MANEPKAMREIHEIRAKLYEETKNMTPEEHTVFYRDKAEEAAKRHGLKLKRPTPSLHDTAAR